MEYKNTQFNDQIKQEIDLERCSKASIFISQFLTKFPVKKESLLVQIKQPNKDYQQYHHELTKLAWELDEIAMAKFLREYRVEQQVVLACKDITGFATVTETLASISALACAILDVTYRFLYSRLSEKYGVPVSKKGEKQNLVILGMGKLGGYELNFSSDIDLIMAYPENGETDINIDATSDDSSNKKSSIANELFFHRLTQKLIKLLDKYDENGFVYRIDMRLKPFGSVGTLCTTFASMEKYYLEHGRNWERYALIKMKPVAGDVESGEKLIALLSSFVYQRHVDYSAVGSIDEMKQKIIANSQEKKLKNNLKLGTGGIREIEFIVQALQLIYGGRITELRNQSLLKNLKTLVDRKLMTEKVGKMLNENYQYLRKVENAVQYYQDQQTHELPVTVEGKLALITALGIADWDILITKIERIRFEVSELFSRIFASQNQDKDNSDDEKRNQSYWLKLLDASNIKESSQLATAFATFYNKFSSSDSHNNLHSDLGEKYLIRLNWVMPQVIKALEGEENPEKVGLHMLDLLESIADKSVYLSLLVENNSVLKKIMQLFMRSSWMTKFLCEHPLVIDELIHENYETTLVKKENIYASLDHALQQSVDNKSRLQKLLDFKNAQVFRIASADLQNKIKLVHVSDQLSWVAESILEEIISMTMGELTEKYGHPSYEIDGERFRAEFGVVAYGKLGSLEMGYGSDLDLVFLHNSQGKEQQTNGDKTIANEVFFTRCVQKILQALTAITPNGKLYEVDTRLRPSGQSGMATASLTTFLNYQQNEAWTWEHQALVRARFVTGGDNIRWAFNEIRKKIICQPRDKDKLKQQVLSMREKMWKNKETHDDSLFYVKSDPGGVTDIEFIVQYLLLLHAKDNEHLIRCSDNLRQISALELFEILPTFQASELREIYRSYRLKSHHLQLKNQKRVVNKTSFSEEIKIVKNIWQEIFELNVVAD